MVNTVDVFQVALDLVGLVVTILLSARMVLFYRQARGGTMGRTFLTLAVVFLLLFALQVVAFFSAAPQYAQVLFSAGVLSDVAFKLSWSFSSFPWDLLAAFIRLVVLLVLYYAVLGMLRTIKAYEHLQESKLSTRGLE